ncbi:cyd operon protein YbgE [Vibrio maerlii]|uniref:cyd operon protein YbgE n=1 Tax=Vibrio maerlii TaxID=2231648 RepID=UPI000E3CB960|nr:cyd operon protein YbgE [Vibrio maerlii]
MSNLNTTFNRLHQPMNKVWLRVALFIIAVAHVGVFMWEPEVYAEQIGGFTPLMGICFVWAICSSMVYSVGFIPILWIWQVLFSPYISYLILVLFSAAWLF